MAIEEKIPAAEQNATPLGACPSGRLPERTSVLAPSPKFLASLGTSDMLGTLCEIAGL